MDEIRAVPDALVPNYSQLRVNVEDLAQIRWLAIDSRRGPTDQKSGFQSGQGGSAKIQAVNSAGPHPGTPIENRLLDIWSLMAFAGHAGRARFPRIFPGTCSTGARIPLCQERLSARLLACSWCAAPRIRWPSIFRPGAPRKDVLCNVDEAQEEGLQSPRSSASSRSCLAAKTTATSTWPGSRSCRG